MQAHWNLRFKTLMHHAARYDENDLLGSNKEEVKPISFTLSAQTNRLPGHLHPFSGNTQLNPLLLRIASKQSHGVCVFGHSVIANFVPRTFKPHIQYVVCAFPRYRNKINQLINVNYVHV